MSEQLTKQLELVIDYLMNNYYDDVERMAKIKMISQVIAVVGKPDQIANTVDKVALFNGIKKSYPPKEPTSTKIIKGIVKVGGIFYG